MQYKKAFFLVALVFAAAFVLFIAQYEKTYLKKQQTLVKEHAQVVASSVWTLFTPISEKYLSHSLRTHQYRSMSIVSVGQLEVFQDRYELTGLEGDLYRLGVIPVITLKTPVIYQGHNIGELRVEIYKKTLYVYSYVLLVLVLLLTIFWFVVQVIADRQKLRQRITDKTQELAFKNRALKLEIEERALTLERQKEAEENLKATLDSIGDGVIATDRNACITRINPVATLLTGWAAEDAVGHPIEDVYRLLTADGADDMQNPVHEVIRTRRSADLSTDVMLVSRSDIHYRIAHSAAPILSEDDQLDGVVLVFRDMTEYLQMQEQLKQSEKMQAIGELAGGIAHDFNNMLSGILGGAEMIKRKHVLDDSDRFLKIIIDSAERAAKLTSNLLSFARKQPVSSEPLDIHALLDGNVALLENTLDKRVRIKTHLAADSCVVSGDAALLQNAFLNLCINAGHALPGGGEIVLKTCNRTLNRDDCAASTFSISPGEFIQIDVIDNGDGIPPELLPRIFDPFFTTKEHGKGTGLGLAAVFGTVQQLSGLITVDSRLGSGTTFSIFLPLANEAVRPELNRNDALILGSGHVLVVDDEALMRETCSGQLLELGYTVEVVENGVECLHRYRTEPERFDLIVLDMMMPEMNGRDCFDELIAINPDVNVVLATGFFEDLNLEEMYAKGLRNIIKKPYNLNRLSYVAHHAINRDEVENFQP